MVRQVAKMGVGMTLKLGTSRMAQWVLIQADLGGPRVLLEQLSV